MIQMTVRPKVHVGKLIKCEQVIISGKWKNQLKLSKTKLM